jgi:hypothetical protein
MNALRFHHSLNPHCNCDSLELQEERCTMAQKINVTLEDDLTGGTADETVSFSLDGTSYEIDLTTKNAKGLRDALAPYVGAGRRASSGGGRRSGRRSSSADRGRTQEIRAWAKKKGVKVSERGRISSDVVAQFEAANRGR